jgi:AAA+ ATPase superfamily predicted ATPase
MFVGREKELSALDTLYHEDAFQMVVLYGRRRVGKTSLISAYIKDKPALLFTGGSAETATFIGSKSSGKLHAQAGVRSNERCEEWHNPCWFC